MLIEYNARRQYSHARDRHEPRHAKTVICPRGDGDETRFASAMFARTGSRLRWYAVVEYAENGTGKRSPAAAGDRNAIVANKMAYEHRRGICGRHVATSAGEAAWR